MKTLVIGVLWVAGATSIIAADAGSWRLTSSVLDEKGTFEGKRTRATR